MPSEKHTNKDLPPGQKPIKQHLRWGRDRPTIGVPVPKIDLKSWALVVEEEVAQSLRLSWDDLQKLPKVESISDFHCVEG
ncbi:MAG: molybdopterin-dependent oxidoreductase [Candidatus Bathyarchaeota archaeon]|nr:molybdopterin-dependent oxidoreductase [Candidatus Bathyarchaeota archaeon]MDI6806023.1 molybdopterin-dependent oxidoreductase [Candidatus Bathyarchaeia archaeon]